MTNTQLGIFCLVGSIATLIAGYGLVLLTGRNVKRIVDNWEIWYYKRRT